jgi:hypothetical protein
MYVARDVAAGVSTTAQEHCKQAVESLGLRAGAVGAGTDAEKLELPKIEDSSGIYDSDEVSEQGAQESRPSPRSLMFSDPFASSRFVRWIILRYGWEDGWNILKLQSFLGFHDCCTRWQWKRVTPKYKSVEEPSRAKRLKPGYPAIAAEQGWRAEGKRDW